MPTGPGIIGIDLGGNAYRDRDYVLLNNGSVYSSAKYVASYNSGLTDSSGQTGHAGTSGDPYLNPSYALSQMTGGGLLYMRGGTYRDLKRQGGQGGSGPTIKGTSRTKTTPLIIMPYPGESVVIDPGNRGSSDTGGFNSSSAFNIEAQAGEFLIIGPITAQNILSTGIYSDSTGQTTSVTTGHGVLYNITVQDVGKIAIGSNIAAIKTYSTDQWVIQDCTIRRIYSQEVSGSLPPNPYDGYGLGLANGIQLFSSTNISIIKNTFDLMARPVAYKGEPSSQVTPNLTLHVSHNLFLRANTALFEFEGNDYEIDGGTPSSPYLQSVWQYNVSDNPSSANDGHATPAFLSTYGIDGSGGAQAANFQFSNNVFRHMGASASGALDIESVTDLWSWSNLFDATWTLHVKLSNGSLSEQIAYSDYNDYANSTAQWSLTGNSFANLAAWQAATTALYGTYLARSLPDLNAQTLSPSYTNASINDYRITSGSLATAGRFGRPIGVGNETVGALSIDHWSSVSDLSLSATAIKVSAGLSYFHVTLSNAVPNNASTIAVSTTLPIGATLIPASSSNNCIQSGQTVTCTLTSLASGASQIFTITVSTNTTQSLSLSFATSSSNEDTNNDNNTVVIVAAPPVLGDFIKVQQFLLNQHMLTTQEVQRLDVYPAGQGDGVITFSDWWLLQQIILGSK
jgi:hypothetical protein